MMKKFNEIWNTMSKNREERKERRRERRENRIPMDRKEICLIGLGIMNAGLGLYSAYTIHNIAACGLQIDVDVSYPEDSPAEEVPFDME